MSKLFYKLANFWVSPFQTPFIVSTHIGIVIYKAYLDYHIMHTEEELSHVRQ
jgi:hypothetical protein